MAKVYAVLLRGVNVGGKNKLVMREFVQTLERLGASSVETIINSGNAVLHFDGDARALRDSVDRALRDAHGLFDERVCCRSSCGAHA